MPLTSSKEMLKKAQAEGYAVGAFNVENMEMAQAVISAAEELHSPVIIQTTPGTLRYATVETFFANVASLAAKTDTPVALHLDHGSSFEMCAQAAHAGYTSIMIDGSKLPLEENIAITRKVVEMCEPMGIPVEGEIGRVGGKEDDIESKDVGYTIPEEAVVFERETGLSSMAVGVGTAHGVYAVEPVLNVELISRLKEALTVPMVLHGASGLSVESVQDCIRRGMCKINIATELRIAFTEGVKQALEEKPTLIDPKAMGVIAREKVKEVVRHKMEMCGSCGKG